MNKTSSILPTPESLLTELGIATQAIKAVNPPWQRTHYMAALNWLTKHKSSSDSGNLEQVRGLLEAFHHFCTVEDLQKASGILTIQLNTATHEELHNQLYTWGNCQEQIQLYEALLGKLDRACDSIFLNGLGLAYRSLGKYAEAAKFYHQSFILASQVNDLEGQGTALCNLGEVFCLLSQYSQAIACNQKALKIARALNNQAGQIAVLSSLGLIFQALGDYNQAFEYH